MFLVSSGSYFSQNTNLSQNPGFEVLVDYWPACFANNINLVSQNAEQQHSEDYWANAWPWTVPQKPSVFSCNNSNGTPDLWCPDANSGKYYGEVHWGEFLTQPLSANLQIGHSYYIEYHARKEPRYADWEIPGGLRLLTSKPIQCGSKKLKKEGTGPSHLQIPYNEADGTWFKVSNYLVMDKAYSWICLGYNKGPGNRGIGIGNKKFNADFGKPELTGSTLFFDDFRIYDVGTSYCPEYNKIQNLGFDHMGKITYRSELLTISGSNVDNTVPQGNVVIGTEGIVRFQSSQLVSLMDGFGVQSGSEFEAVISPCGIDCPLPIAETADDLDACGSTGSTYSIGSNPVFGQTYSWSVGEPIDFGIPFSNNLLHYLSNTNTANPTFTQPPGSGTITYILTATNSCGQSSTDEIIINFDNNPNPNPSALGSGPVNGANGNYSVPTSTITFMITNANTNTEAIYVDIYDAANHFIEQYEIDDPNYFNTSPAGVVFNTYPDTYPPCDNYYAMVYQKNHCSENVSSPIRVDIAPEGEAPTITLQPNVFTPNADHINDNFTWQVNAASTYTIDVYDRNGVPVYNNSGIVYGNNAYAWDGSCNALCPLINPHGTVCDGTYYYVISFSNCFATTSAAGNVTLFGTGCSYPPLAARIGSGINPGEPIALQKEDLVLEPIELTVFPNPNDGNFKIGLPNLHSELTVEIINSMGSLIKIVQWSESEQTPFVDIQGIAQGLYYVVVKQNGTVIGTTRIVVNK